jgi:hypothetical protein
MIALATRGPGRPRARLDSLWITATVTAELVDNRD